MADASKKHALGRHGQVEEVASILHHLSLQWIYQLMVADMQWAHN